MHACDGRTRRVRIGAADGVVEEQDSLRAGYALQQQLLHFGVVDLLDVLVVLKGGLLRGDVGEGGEGVVVEGEFGFVPTQVVDGDLVDSGAEVVLWLSGGGRFDVVEGGGAVSRWRVEGKGGGDGPGGD